VVVAKHVVVEPDAVTSLGAAGTEVKAREDASSRGPCQREPSLSAVVLCGGQSSRMGRDKAALPLGTCSLLERAASLLAEITPDVRLACGAEPRYAQLNLPLVLDRVSDAGPLGGLEAALASASPGLVIAIACDMPRLDARALRALVDFARTDDLDVAMLRSESGLEPLCAVWSTRVAGAVRAALDAGRFKMTSVFDVLLPDGSKPRVGTLTVDELLAGDVSTTESAARAASALVGNVNTPEDYARELELHAAPVARELLGPKARR